MTKPSVLLLGDFTARSAHQADRLRAAEIPAWTASTDFEVHWLLQRASVSASIALVDLRGIVVCRSDEVERFAALALEARLPVILVGASDEEARAFQGVIAALPRAATDEDVAETIAAMKLVES